MTVNQQQTDALTYQASLFILAIAADDYDEATRVLNRHEAAYGSVNDMLVMLAHIAAGMARAAAGDKWQTLLSTVLLEADASGTVDPAQG